MSLQLLLLCRWIATLIVKEEILATLLMMALKYAVDVNQTQPCNLHPGRIPAFSTASITVRGASGAHPRDEIAVGLHGHHATDLFFNHAHALILFYLHTQFLTHHCLTKEITDDSYIFPIYSNE